MLDGLIVMLLCWTQHVLLQVCDKLCLWGGGGSNVTISACGGGGVATLVE